MIHFIYIFIALVQAAPTCPVKGKLPADLNPPVVKGYLNNNKDVLTDPGDLICCLARDQKVEIAIGMNSVAAQNGDFENPRVLVITRDEQKHIKGILSINSGAKGFNQGQAAEFMFNNKFKDDLDFFDIDFATKNPHMSNANPESCMGCHALGGNPNDIGGKKVLFDEVPWPRFFDKPGTPGFSEGFKDIGGKYCKNASEIGKIMQEKAIKAVRTQDRYACIKDAPIVTAQSVDVDLQYFNARRVVRYMRRSPNYENFKFALFGSFFGCQADPSWIPSSVASGMSQMNSIDAEMRKTSGEKDYRRLIDENYEKNRSFSLQRDKEQKKVLEALRSNTPAPPFLFDRNKYGYCSYPTADMQPSKYIKFTNRYPIYDKYIADTNTYSAFVFSPVPFIRYLFESRGIDLGQSGMSLYPNYGRFNDVLFQQLMDKEPEDSPIRKILKDTNNSYKFFSMGSGDNSKVPLCVKLKEQSLSALKDVQLPSQPDSPDKIEK